MTESRKILERLVAYHNAPPYPKEQQQILDDARALLAQPAGECCEVAEAVKWLEAHPGVGVDCDTRVAEPSDSPRWYLTYWPPLDTPGRYRTNAEGATLPEAVTALKSALTQKETP